MFRSIVPRISRTSLRPSVSQRYSVINYQERYLSVSPCLQYERKSRQNREQQQNDQQLKKKKITYSKRRFVNIEDADKRSNRHLYTMPSDVYGTSDRVGQLLSVAGFDAAVEFLIHLPLDLQSTVAWNQLLGYCAKQGKAIQAETLFTQMRKRGLQPSDRTFAHLLTAFINSTSTSSVERAESWVARMEEYGVEPTVYHYNILLNVYKKAGCNNQIMAKVRQMMRDDDRLPYPDQVTLSIALQVCPLLTSQHDKEIKRIWQYILDSLDCDVQTHVQQPTPVSSLQAKVNQLQSSDPTYRQDHASLLEQRKSAVKYPQEAIQVDDTLVVALIRALARSNGTKKHDASTLDDGQQGHFGMAVEIVDKLYGLRPNNNNNINNNDDDDDGLGFTPGVTVLDAMVRYCGAVRQFDVGEALFDSALQKFPKLEPDSRAYSAYAWMQTNTRRKSWTKASST